MNAEAQRGSFADALAVFGEVKEREPMARHTSLRIGGPADYLVTPRSVRTVPGLLACARALGTPVTVVGNGTNLLVRDGGIEGVVIRLARCTAINPIGPDTLVAESGVPFPRLVRDAARRGLTGLEFAAGIPGTVGGAVRMNAGAHGGQLSDSLECVDMVTMDGDLITLPVERLGLGYRTSALPDGIVLSAVFSLRAGDEQEIRRVTEENLAYRERTQPILTPNAGSFFKNPPGDYAARLIEAAGCKEWEQGDAVVSGRHANFIVNVGKARASDVMILVERVRQRVQEHAGVTLEMEVKVIGRDPIREDKHHEQ
ncbi:MAG: UDP-N-acetylmuramate dehydrogenase [Nitrospirota bacterium]|nr:UDP-N-acetylmuramate dehydrogenase [Nitrospirota bacterium]